ncbi:MAG: alginate lyase family protein [Bacteroidota bacterium]
MLSLFLFKIGSMEGQPAVYLYNPADLLQAKQAYGQEKAPFVTLVGDLKLKADQLLSVKPFSVMQKTMLPPSKDKHDYYSLGVYWWPNPATKDGLPYVRHDGKRNPEYDRYDGVAIHKMTKAVFTLSLAYFYTTDEAYAKKANELLYTWFINPATKMNPHLEYGQAIPGITEGRGIGIIETGTLLRVVSAVGFLGASPNFPTSNYDSLQTWFKEYTHWLVTSQKGWDERMWHNNHGSSYDSQVAGFSLFVGEDSLATLILDSVIIKRINRQIAPDGSQPWELERTKSMSYSIKNLKHLIENAILAKHYGIDLWNYESADGRSIKQAIRFLIPYMLGEKEWPYTQYGGIKSKRKDFKELIWMANRYLEDDLIQKAVEQLCLDTKEPLKINLLYPKVAQPYIILKLDDLWCKNDMVHPGWERVIEFLNSQEVKGTIGLIGSSLEKDNPVYFDWIKQREAEGYEIWNHGFCHCRIKDNGTEIREFRGKELEDQSESIIKTQDLAKEKLGITLRTFGAPYNSTDEHTTKALANHPDLKIWLYKETTAPTNKFVLNRIPEVNIEYPVHQPDFEKFKAGYAQFKTEPILVIQGHPRSWTEDQQRFENFKKIILFLKEEGVSFTTPYEYYLMQNSRAALSD